MKKKNLIDWRRQDPGRWDRAKERGFHLPWDSTPAGHGPDRDTSHEGEAKHHGEA